MSSTVPVNFGEGPQLDLGNLKKDAPGVTRAVGEAYGEAASVCLEDQGHSSGVPMEINGNFKGTCVLIWGEVTDTLRRCHGDLQYATEWGAYGCAFVLLHALTDLTVVERAKKGTGFDYWLGSKSGGRPLFQGKTRLEVSGILNGDETTINARVREKLKQVAPSDGVLPAIIVVVEFGKPCSMMNRK